MQFSTLQSSRSVGSDAAFVRTLILPFFRVFRKGGQHVIGSSRVVFVNVGSEYVRLAICGKAHAQFCGNHEKGFFSVSQKA